MSTVTESDILNLLRGVVDPELGSNVVDLGMAPGATIDADGNVVVDVLLTTSGCPLRAQIKKDVETRVGSHPGVTSVKIKWGEMTQEQKSAAMGVARKNAQSDAPETEIPPNARVVTIASGKGGVGKSSVTVNLAAVLAFRGFTVGVMDADIWGFSVPRMTGVDARLEVIADTDAPVDESGRKRGKIVPNERVVGDGLLKVVSMGNLVDDEDTAIMWRGFMLNRAVQHFLEDVRWGDLDYLLIDMPPGTGDVQMGLARMLPRAEMVIVTTPSLSAQKVAIRAADMARRSYIRVAGVIENMTAFVCDHGESYPLFGEGGGLELADQVGVPLLGQIPLEPAVAAGGDVGKPIALGTGPAADAFRALADEIVTNAIPPVEFAGCTARILEAAEAALGPIESAS